MVEEVEGRGPLKLCVDCKEWMEENLFAPSGINMPILTLVLITGGRCDIVEKSQCDACKAKGELLSIP